MAVADFEGIFEPRPGRRPRREPPAMLSYLIKGSFKLPTLLAVGALGQAALFALLPARYAVVPPAIVALNAIVTTVIQAMSARNAFTNNVIFRKTSAQLPDKTTGRYGSQPAAKPLVVLHLGVRLNSPLGVLMPGAREMAEYFTDMNNDLKKRADEYGLLSSSMWTANDRTSNNTILYIYYFRDIDGLNKFAHDPIHRKGWDWYYKAGIKNIAIFHEAFCIDPQSYETVYVNSSPVLLGAADTKCRDKSDGTDVWVNPLVNADVGPLRTQFGRMGRAVRERLGQGP